MRRGGILRLRTFAADRKSFDPHHTRFHSTPTWMGFYMNQLIRWRNRERGVMEADIASLPEMPDDSTYVFRLDRGARFWDQFPTDGGRLVSAEDIRANVERQLDLSDSQRLRFDEFRGFNAFRDTASLDTPDNKTFIAQTDGPDATYLHRSFLSLSGRITSSEAISSFGNRWSAEPENIELSSGTGMYIPRGYGPMSGVLLTRNPNFWKIGADGQALPYPDAVVLYHARFPETERSWYRQGYLSMCGQYFPHSWVEAMLEEFPLHRSSEVPLGHTIDIMFNFNQEYDGPDKLGNPWADRRIAYAFHLATDRHQLMDLIHLGAARLSATSDAPWFSRGWTIPPEELLTYPGFRRERDADLTMARDLLSAAGIAGDDRAFHWLVPDLWVITHPGIDEKMQAMYEQALGVRIAFEILPYQTINARMTDGTLPGRIASWTNPPKDLDPTDAWNRSHVAGGDANFLDYDYPPAQELIVGMKRDLNMERRQQTARELLRMFLGVHPEHGLEALTPRPAVMNGFWRHFSWPYVHNSDDVYQFGDASYRFDETWLDSAHPDYPG